MKSRTANDSNEHLNYVGHVLEIIKNPPEDSRVTIETLPGLIQQRYGVKLAAKTVEKVVSEIWLVLSPCPRGLTLSPLVVEHERSTFFESRATQARRAKRAVAIHIYDKVLQELDAIFLDAGSANHAIAEEMAWGKKQNFTVLTNNVRAVRTFLANSTIRVFVTGGAYDLQDEALVGKGAQFDLNWFCCKTAFVGASALSPHHVYNHAISGEEEIKKHYWQIPADELIVPATLGKFQGKDAACFGSLFKQPPKRTANENTDGIYHVAREEHQRALEEWKHHMFSDEFHPDAPGFRAKKCTIVIEPGWMIDDQYKDKPELKDQLLGIVGLINKNTITTNVSVVLADVTREHFSERLF